MIGDADPFIKWIEGPTPNGAQGKGHAPQPYFQMESVLREMGAEGAADQVAYARHLDRLQSYGSGVQDLVNWVGEQVWRWVVGYGVCPFRLLWWVAGLILVGTFMARRTTLLETAGWWDCFWYSVENTLPLIEPSGDNRSVTHYDGFTRGFFHFQKVAGFVLATILVGALTLMGN